MSDFERGLEARYHVQKIEDPTGRHDDCRFFVLDPQHDQIARFALAEYARVAEEKGYAALAEALNGWLKDADRGVSGTTCSATAGVTMTGVLSQLVELSPGVWVDPTQIAAMEGVWGGETRVWLRGASASEFVLATRPINEVVKAIETALNSDPSG